MSNGNVVIIDDDFTICNSLKYLLESVNFSVKTYDNPKAFIETLDLTQKICLIIDIRMPIMSGLELLERLNLKKHLHISVIVVTAYGDVQVAVQAMKAGVIDFFLKPINHNQLLDTIQKCVENQSYSIVTNELDERFKSLTQREQQILEKVVDGKLNKQISYDLDISMSTVEVHRSKLMKKLKAKSLAELVKICLIRLKKL